MAVEAKALDDEDEQIGQPIMEPSGSNDHLTTWAGVASRAKDARSQTARVFNKKQKSKSAKKVKRQLESRATYGGKGSSVKAAINNHVHSSTSVKVDVEVGDLPTTKHGFIGPRDCKCEEERVYYLHELIGEYGFGLVEWDGRTAIALVDREDRVIGVLGGRPKGETEESWRAVVNDATEAMKLAGVQVVLTEEQKKHRRGSYAALATGLSFGGGQKVPGKLLNTVENTAVIEQLVGNSGIRRLVGHANGIFRTYAPKLYNYYEKTLGQLYSTGLFPVFGNSIWSAATFNLGPQTVTVEHRDFMNLSFGLCAVTALGDFDAKKGGHIILWDMKLVIEFPPGSTILIPSAALQHSNVPIQEGERRMSITQYSAGGLFRWVENGFKTLKALMKQNGKGKGKETAHGEAEGVWARGLMLFSKLDELKKMGRTE